MIMDKDKILICGGEDINGNLFNDTFLFETSTKKFIKELIFVILLRLEVRDACFKENFIVWTSKENMKMNRKKIWALVEFIYTTQKKTFGI